MIKVLVKKDSIQIKGHANYDDLGKDIVCAAVSATVLTTINAILRLNEQDIQVEEEKDVLTIHILNDSSNTKILLDNMISLLRELEQDYKKNITIKEE